VKGMRYPATRAYFLLVERALFVEGRAYEERVGITLIRSEVYKKAGYFAKWRSKTQWILNGSLKTAKKN
jgi:hypothetical protein